MEKSSIRKNVLLKLKNMSKDEYKEKSERIRLRLIEMEEFKEAKTIAITVSRSREVETHAIIETCWAAGKRVAVPKCEVRERAMDFREISSFEQLETVYLDLEEPDPSLTSAVKKEEIDLLIVPGVVFTIAGFRIGYGGGYYDRFLEDYAGTELSLAFELQIVDQVPVERYDLPVGKIITEERVIRCSQPD